MEVNACPKRDAGVLACLVAVPREGGDRACFMAGLVAVLMEHVVAVLATEPVALGHPLGCSGRVAPSARSPMNDSADLHHIVSGDNILDADIAVDTVNRSPDLPRMNLGQVQSPL